MKIDLTVALKLNTTNVIILTSYFSFNTNKYVSMKQIINW